MWLLRYVAIVVIFLLLLVKIHLIIKGWGYYISSVVLLDKWEYAVRGQDNLAILENRRALAIMICLAWSIIYWAIADVVQKKEDEPLHAYRRSIEGFISSAAPQSMGMIEEHRGRKETLECAEIAAFSDRERDCVSQHSLSSLHLVLFCMYISQTTLCHCLRILRTLCPCTLHSARPTKHVAARDPSRGDTV